MTTSVYHIQSKLDQECYPETEVESFMLKALNNLGSKPKQTETVMDANVEINQQLVITSLEVAEDSREEFLNLSIEETSPPQNQIDYLLMQLLLTSDELAGTSL